MTDFAATGAAFLSLGKRCSETLLLLLAKGNGVSQQRLYLVNNDHGIANPVRGKPQRIGWRLRRRALLGGLAGRL
jgi:hypothetical protein